jgi:hypothetical protein
MAMASVSKTDYLLWRACQKNAWLRIHKPDVCGPIELTEYEQSVIDMGVTFSRAEFRKLPVFFAVSREFRQRMVSARLTACFAM